MKLVLAGSLGRINLPLVQLLQNQRDFDITIITSNDARKKEIEAFGNNFHGAVGSLEDPIFLTNILQGAELVYAMVPPTNVMNPDLDNFRNDISVGAALLAAILSNAATIKKLVFLSTVGAHMSSGNGILQGATVDETLFKVGLKGTEIEAVMLRPVGFYYNLLDFVPVIKQTGKIMSNFGGEDVGYWVSPKDIASVAYEELLQKGTSKYKIRYIVSDKKTCDEIATILGKEISIPDLKWELIPGEDVLKLLLDSGMNRGFAEGTVQMQENLHTGVVWEDLLKPGNMPLFGPTKFEEFAANEFKTAFFSK